jgi:replicative DNA helicase
MHATDMGKEEPARLLTHVVDLMRARHNCAVVMESHAPHAGVSGRSLRPVGSSLFMRWPEFGYGIRKEQDGSYTFASWRGPRDERSWPRKLRRGGDDEWPWMDATNDSTYDTSKYWASLDTEDSA